MTALTSLYIAALTIELVDELVDGATGAAWPYLRADLHLDYTAIGLLLGVPALLANVVEPLFGVLADAGHRRRIVLGGGLAFSFALALTALAGNFWVLLISLLLFYPASGAFVSLTQAAWMDAEPARMEQSMARWTLAGSVGNVVGPLLIGTAVALGAGWRPVFVMLALLSLVALFQIWRVADLSLESQDRSDQARNTRSTPSQPETRLLRPGASGGPRLAAVAGSIEPDARRVPGISGTVFRGCCSHDPGTGGAGGRPDDRDRALGDALVVPLLEKLSGVSVVKWSAVLVSLLFTAFLLVPHVGWKIVGAALIGLFTSGWYAVLQARLYEALPERSGTVVALGSITGMLGAGILFLLGWLADHTGVQNALWFLLLGPLLLAWRLPAVSLRR